MFASVLCGCWGDSVCCFLPWAGWDPVSTALGCMVIYEVDTDLLAPSMLGALVGEFFNLLHPGRGSFSCCSVWARRLREVESDCTQAGLLLPGHSDTTTGLGMTRTLSKGAGVSIM